MSDILSKCKIYKKNLIIAGDFNLNLIQYQNDDNVNNFLNLMLHLNMTPTIYRPTRFSAQNATLIDNIFTNINLDSVETSIIDYDISHHLPLLFIAKKQIDSNATTDTDFMVILIFDHGNTNFYDHSYCHKNKFFNLLQTANWFSVIYNSNDVDANIMFEKFGNEYERLFKYCSYSSKVN